MIGDNREQARQPLLGPPKVAEDDDEEQLDLNGQSGLFGACCNFINCVIGAGIIGTGGGEEVGGELVQGRVVEGERTK
jgi:hypothetical protein